MRKIMILCTGLLIAMTSVSTVYAQYDTASVRIRREERLQQMKTDLQLTDVQSDSVIMIHREFQIKRDSVGMNRHLDGNAKMSSYQVLMKAMNNRIRAVLGDDLFNKYDAWMNAHSNIRKK